MTRPTRIALALATLLLAREGRALAETLTIQLDTLGESLPAVVCVGATLIEGRRLQWWMEAGVKTGASASEKTVSTRLNALVNDQSKVSCVQGLGDQDEQHFYKCFLNERPNDERHNGEDRALVIEVQGVGVEAASWSGDTVQIATVSQVGGTSKGRLAQLTIHRGSYFEQEALSFPLDGRNQFTKMKLRPLCVKRQVILPRHVCLRDPDKQKTQSNDNKRLYLSEGCAKAKPEDADKSGCQSVEIGADGMAAIPLRDREKVYVHECVDDATAHCTGCDTILYADIGTPVPDRRIQLHPWQFGFKWKTNCLSPTRKCPEVQTGAHFTCQAMPEKQAAPLGANGTTRCPKKDDGYCFYRCEGNADLPAKIRMVERRDTVNQNWEELLSYPGEELRGYIPPEQREVHLDWSWGSHAAPEEKMTCEEMPSAEEVDASGPRTSPGEKPGSEIDHLGVPTPKQRIRRGKKPGSEIDYLEVRTPEGRVHNLGLGTGQLRVPELECNDGLALTYKGRLTYKTEYNAYDPDKGVKVSDPDGLRAKAILFGVAVGGGLRILPGQPNRTGVVEPAAEVDAVLAIPAWDFHLFRPEIRATAILGAARYCFQLARESGGACDQNGQLAFWRLLLEPGLTKYWGTILRLELSPGIGFSTYFWERDSWRIRRGPVLALRFGAGIELFRGATLLFATRLMYPEVTYGTTFDEAGMASYGPLQDGMPSLNFGLMLRLDDIL
jgi:hypothetical protein